jgi:hypothetical protein
MLAVERVLEDERTGPAAKQNHDLKVRTSRAIIAQHRLISGRPVRRIA